MQEVIWLKPEWRAPIRRIARERNAVKTSVPSRKKDAVATEGRVHLRGVKGEAALASQLRGVELDRRVRKDGDDGHDLLLQGGETVEVRTRGEGRDFAMYDAKSRLQADLGVLCWLVEDWTVRLVGWITQEGFEEQSRILMFGGEPRRGVRCEEMRPMVDFFLRAESAPTADSR